MKPNIHRETARSYAALLQDVDWLRFRASLIERRECCQSCGSDTKLQIHHCVYIEGRMPWEYEDHQVKVLCNNCHDDITEYADRVWMLVNSFDPEKARLLHNLVAAVCEDEDLKDGRLIAALRVASDFRMPTPRVTTA